MKLLVLGANGMLGHKICQLFSPDWQVFGAVRTPQAMSFLTDKISVITQTNFAESALDMLLQQTQPDYVINCLGVVKQRDEDLEDLVRFNALLPHVLSRLCTRHKARLIHISTDCVFSGTSGNYCETDTPDPIDMYGYSKRMGEFSSEVHTVFRTSFIGFQLTGSWSLLEWFRTQTTGEVSGYTKAIFSGVTTREFALTLKAIIERNALKPGLFHLAAQPISKYDLLAKLHDILNIGVRPIPDDKVVINRSLNAEQAAKKMGITVQDWDSMITALQEDIDYYH